MEKDLIFERVNKVFQTVFDDETISVNENTTSNDIEDWVSLEHISLIVAIEQEFNIKFSMGEVSNMKNVGEMVNIITSKM